MYVQYREPGVLLWRGFTLQEFANQCFGNKSDYGKGRQMPVHYGSNKLNYFTVSATIAYSLLTQLVYDNLMVSIYGADGSFLLQYAVTKRGWCCLFLKDG